MCLAFLQAAGRNITILAMLAERGFTGLTIADLGKLNPPDEFETELRIMAEVRGYFQVAYKVRIGFASTLYISSQ